MACAITNKVYSMRNSPDFTFILWSFREINTAIFVANDTLCWPLARQAFKLTSFDGGAQSDIRQLNIKVEGSLQDGSQDTR